MNPIEPSTTTAAVTAVSYAALAAGHWIGDYPAQRHHDAVSKGHPADDQLTAGVPWYQGWASIGRHVSAYVACQALAFLLIAAVAPLTITGVWAALTISGSTHAVIDRRWPVAMIIKAKGGCPGWNQAPAAHDQALHHGLLLPAAVSAALVTTVASAVGVTVICAALLAVAVLWERRHGRTLADQLVATGRR